MLVSSIPAKFPIPFAADAGGPFIRPIPVASQIGINPGFASLTDGFVPLNMDPVASGGIPPFGQDMNGILNQATAWLQWMNAGGPIAYDATFSGQISGYPKGALIASGTTFGLWWLNTADNNTTNPDTGGANWQPVSLLGGTNSTGDMKFRPTTEVLPGWVIANATTIGNAASNATQRANADTAALFTWLWTNFSNTQCPVFTSGGSSTTRGASAAADYAANKAIQVLDWRGAGPMGVDTMQGGATTRLSGVPVVSGGTTIPGSVFGENLHVLVLAELANHNHGIIDPGHFHNTFDPGHHHTINDPGHSHGVSDPGHTHGITDPGHTHSVSGQVLNAGTLAFTSPGPFVNATGTANSAATGISVNAAVTGVSTNTDTTGITDSDATTGINIIPGFTNVTTQNNGGSFGHNTVQRSNGVTWHIKL